MNFNVLRFILLMLLPLSLYAQSNTKGINKSYVAIKAGKGTVYGFYDDGLFLNRKKYPDSRFTWDALGGVVMVYEHGQISLTLYTRDAYKKVFKRFSLFDDEGCSSCLYSSDGVKLYPLIDEREDKQRKN